MFPYVAVEPVVADPCDPNPCGPNSNPPRARGTRCDCSCQPTMIGSPPNCRPECQVNSDCRSSQACIGNRCIDPCPGLCGDNAACRVTNHVPICVCQPGYFGDPFVQCRLITSESTWSRVWIYLCLEANYYLNIHDFIWFYVARELSDLKAL